MFSRKAQRLMASSAIALAIALLSTPAWAQDPAEPADEVQEEEIIVTGSRIARPDYSFSNPVTSVDARTIEYSGTTNVTDLLQDIPALVNSFDSNDASGDRAFIGGTGLNLLNLRNLGINRTLVLVNSRRHVAGLPDSAAIDTNTIPVDLIERVEVLTGGASAIYGADGVSGVVNFVLRDDFEGLRARAQGGSTEEGGADRYFFSVLAGANFDNDRGNVALGVDWAQDGRLTAFDRDFASTNEVRFAEPPASLGSPFDRIPFNDLRWFESGTGGAVDANFDFGADFDGNTGGPWDPGNFPEGIQSNIFAQGGSATPTGGYSGDLLPELERFGVNLIGHYDITPDIRFFTELKYVTTSSFSVGQPSFDFFLALDPDNFYLQQNPDIVAAAVGNDAPSFGLPEGTVLVTRDNFDFGRRGEDIDRETYRAVFGFEGDLGDWGQWNVSYVYGQTDVENLQINNRYNDRYAAALDVIDDGAGNPICRSNLFPGVEGTNVGWQGWASPTSFTPGPNSGCVPINILGDGSPSQEAIDWIMVNSLATSTIRQHVFSAYLTGNLDQLYTPPAGSIGYSLGVEWRKEESENQPALEDQLGITFGNQLQPSSGEFDVAEIFGEVNVPILEDAPFAETLSVDAAYRYSDYSTIGSTETWKVGAVWAPIEDIRFRATRARAVRAPNIGELFAPAGQDFQFITDPCDINNLDQGTSFRAANCEALLLAAGADPATFEDPNLGVSVPGVTQGNVNLQEETGDTTTIGVIFQPRFAPGLTFSIDYYDIELQDAINTLAPQDLADQCVDLPDTTNPFCSLIERQVGGVGAGGIIGFTRQPENVAEFTTSGYDFSISYLLDPAIFGVEGDWGTFGFRLVGTYLDELSFVNTPGAAPDPDKEEAGAPEWQAAVDIVWERGPWTVNYGYTYWSDTWRFATSSSAAPRLTTPSEFERFSEYSVHDVQVRYDVNPSWTLYFGVDNVGDQQPDYGTTAYPVGPEGRTYYAGVTMELGAAAQ